MFLAGTHHLLLGCFHVQLVGCPCSQPRHLVSVEWLPAGPPDVCGNWAWANGEHQRLESEHQGWVEPWVDVVIVGKPNSCNYIHIIMHSFKGFQNDDFFKKSTFIHFANVSQPAKHSQTLPTTSLHEHPCTGGLAKEAGLQGPDNPAAEQEWWPKAFCGDSCLACFFRNWLANSILSLAVGWR